MPVADPENLGPYRIVRRVGVGGMGVVYEAIHTGLDKRVALKVLPREMAANRLDRFLREARTAAALHHTNIVPVFDVGQVDGVPYYAMQFIDGRPLGHLAATGTRNEGPPNANPTRSYTPEPEGTRTFAGPITAIDRAQAGANGERFRSDQPVGPRASHGKEIRQVVALVLQAAEGLAHAHARGIVHRDVKPSNLLLDGSGVVWVADFGLAFRADDPTLTTEGAILGTPRYMSPEQAQAQKTDARSDVYSLGVTLYELLTGWAAFGGDTPLSVIQNVIALTPPSPRALNRDVPRDLETVVLKAMAKQPGDRYPSARELADDLSRFLAGEPVKARRIGAFGKAWRWAKRNPAVASLLAAVLVVLASGAAVSAFYAQRAAAREAEAKRNEGKANDLLGELGRTIADLHTERKKLLDAEEDNARLVYAARISLAGVALRDNDHVRVGELLRETLPRSGETDPRGWEWHYLFRVVFSESRITVVPGIEAADTTDAERMVFVRASGKNRVEAFSIPARKPLFAHDAPADLLPAGLSPRFPASSGGKRLVYRTNQHLVVWEPESGKELLRLPLAGHRDSSPPAMNGAATRFVRYAPEGENDAPPAFEVWDLETGKRVAALTPPKRFGSTFSHRSALLSEGGRWLAVLIDERRCVVWDVATGGIRLDRLLPGGRDVQTVAAGAANPGMVFSPDERLLVVRGPGGERVEVFDLAAEGGTPSDSLSGFAGQADAIAVSPDGRALAIAETAGIVAVHDLADRTPPQVFRTTYRNLRSLRFSRNGQSLIAHSSSSILEWNLSRPSADALTGLPPRAVTIEGGVIRPDGRAVALSGVWSFNKTNSFATVALWDPATRGSRNLTPSLAGTLEPLRSVSWSADGRFVALLAAQRDGPYDVATRFRFAPPLMHPLSVALLARQALERPQASVVLVMDAQTSRVVQTIHAPVSRPPGARISPCGRWLAIETGDGFAVHAVSNGRLVRSSREPGRIATGAFTTDGGRFVMTRAAGRTGNEAEAIVWDLAAGTEAQFACPGGAIATAAPVVSPDGRWVAVHANAETGSKVIVRDVVSGTHEVVAGIPTGTPSSAARDPVFSPDGRWLIVPGGPRELVLYSTATWQPKLTLTGTTRDQPELVFAPDGRRAFELHSGVKGQTLKVLDAESGQEVLAFACSARQPVRSVLPIFFDGNRLVLVRQWVPAGTTEIETFDGTPVAEETARGRLGVK